MKQRVHIAYFAFLFLHTAQIYSKSQNCLTISCGTQRLNCTQESTECLCKPPTDVATCPEWSTAPVEVKYANRYKRWTLYGKKNDINFTFAEWILPKLYKELPVSNVVITNFCNEATDIYKVMNLTELPEMKTLLILRIRYSCLRDIIGDMQKWTPKLRVLNLDGNKFLKFPKSISKLETLTDLILDENNIKNLSRNDLSSFPNLITLSLKKNQLTTLPEDLLYNLTSLTELNLEGNKLRTIPELFLQKSLKIRGFYVSCNKLTSLPERLFNGLNNIKKISLDRNNLATLPAHLLYYTYAVDIVKLDHNAFTQLPYLKLPPHVPLGATIDFSYNNISLLHVPIATRIPIAKTLILSHNDIKVFENGTNEWNISPHIENLICNFCSLEKLLPNTFDGVTDTLDLSNNRIKHLNFSTLKAFKPMTNIQLAFNDISYVDVHIFKTVFPKSKDYKLKNFNLSSNPISCDCQMIPFIDYIKHQNEKTFKFTLENLKCSHPSPMKGQLLRYLTAEDLFCSYPENCPIGFECFVKRLEDVHEVYINSTATNLTKIPDMSAYNNTNLIMTLKNNEISYLPPKENPFWYNVIYFDLSNNKLKSLSNLTVNPNLKFLNLQNNHLIDFEDEITSLSLSNASVLLSGNVWKCDCAMQDVILKAPHFDDKYKLSCVKDRTKHKYTNIDQLCQVHNRLEYAWLLIPISTLLIILCVLIILSYRFKSEIKYFLFAKGICLNFVTEDDIDTDKLFDAFISYSSEDEDWVCKFLMPGLENCDPPYKLCVHGRDWPGGVLIADQIVRSVESSRRTIFVLTESYLKSHWIRMEFDIAYQQAMKERAGRLIVVVPNEVPDLSQIDSEFRTFIMMTTYIEAKKPYFWRKMRASMPRTRELLTRGSRRKRDEFFLELE